MSAVYVEYDFRVRPLQPGTEILIAELGAVGFESFVETENGVTAYIQKEDWNENILANIQILESKEFDIHFSQTEIEQVNWNAEWEKHFEPIVVGVSCAVRAPFHEAYGVPYEIVIEPKMSFGTGHHETTFMMMQWLLETKVSDLDVLDMGCGTAVLAILASMRGAKSVHAVDIDDWCVENSQENIERNSCTNISVALGDAAVLPTEPTYDLLIANINRNILLKDMATYVKSLRPGGMVLLSGFYSEDLAQITQACQALGLHFIGAKEKHNWIAAKFEYPS